MAPVKFAIIGDHGDLKVSQCTFCAHRGPDATKCKAFPTGIPVKILYNEHDHTLPYEGDNGIRYQAVQLGAVREVAS